MSAVGSAPALSEVPGPSAVGGGFKRFFELTWLLATTDFKLNYLDTAFGYLWSLIRPLMMFAVLYTVFTKVLHFGAGIPHYAAIVLMNIILFGFFSESTTRSVSSIPAHEHIVRKTQFPRLVIPVSIVLTGAFNLCLNLVAVFIFLLATGVEPRLTWLGLPFILLLLATFTSGVAVLLSVLFVRFRDIAQIWGVMALAIFYCTPVLYPVERVPHELHFLLLINPLAPLMAGARRLVVDPNAPSTVDIVGTYWAIIGPAVVFVGVCTFGFWLFNRAAPQVAEEL
jgi:ABC-2 type transport system permease protein